MKQRNMGVVLADILGTTLLDRRIGTSEGQHALERCVRRMERAIEAHGGRILMPAVDEMIATFASADDAIHAAIEMQKRIADLPPVSGAKLSIRIGVHFDVAEDDPDGLQGRAIDAGRALLKLAGPHQIVTSAPTAAALSAPLRQSLRSLEDMAIDTAAGECQLYELIWLPGSATPPAKGRAAPASPPEATPPSPPASERFCVRFNGKAYLVDERTPSLTIGRDKACDIVIRDRKASRVHVRLEKRGRNRFFLVDQSTNGTFIAVGKANELRLHNEEMQLAGRGRLAFGHSTGSEDAEVADFEAL